MLNSLRPLLTCALLAGALPAQAIVGGLSTTAFGQVDNGVQITASWVLTARHVSFSSGSYSNGYGSAVIAARYDLGPGPTLVNDLTLLRLATPIAAAPALDLLDEVLPVGLYSQALAVTIATGGNQSPRGYAFADMAEVVDKIDLKVNNVVGSYDVHWLLAYQPDHSAPYVQGGDSGGGLFLGHITDSTGAALMGITSAQLQDDKEKPYGSGFVQLAAYRGWIDSTMAGDLADTQMASWVSAVPEPATWALWLAGAGLMAGNTARRRAARATHATRA